MCNDSEADSRFWGKLDCRMHGFDCLRSHRSSSVAIAPRPCLPITMAVERKYWVIEQCPFADMCSKASWQRVGKCVSYESPDHSRDFWFLKSFGPGNGTHNSSSSGLPAASKSHRDHQFQDLNYQHHHGHGNEQSGSADVWRSCSDSTSATAPSTLVSTRRPWSWPSRGWRSSRARGWTTRSPWSSSSSSRLASARGMPSEHRRRLQQHRRPRSAWSRPSRAWPSSRRAWSRR